MANLFIPLWEPHPLTGRDGPDFYAPSQIVVSEMRAVLKPQNPPGTPSITWTVRYDTDRDAAGTEIEVGGRTSTNVNAGDSVTGGDLDNATIPAGAWVWMEIVTATTGVDAVESFTVELIGTAT